MRFVAIGFIVIGLVLLLYLEKNDSYYLPDKEPWPTVKGTVLASKLVQKTEDEETGESTFKPVVKYQFEIKGEKFIEKKIFPLDPGPVSRSEAKLVIDRFQPTTEVNVYYNPDPTSSPRSVLIWELPRMLHPMTSVAILCLALGGLTAIYVLICLFLDRHKNV